MTDPGRRRRDVYFELLVTVGLLAVPATLNAVYYRVAGDLRYGSGGREWLFASRAAGEALLVGLFFYVLRANGERLADFTRPARRRDVPLTFALLLATWAAYAAVILALWRWTPLGTDVQTRHLPGVLLGPLSPAFVALLVVNPFCEELWMRAFLQTRLVQLGWPAPLVVMASASLQSAYHVYQGVAFVIAYAAAFGVFAVYYQRSRRVWPVIGVHLIADLSAGVWYATSGS